jgi:hypothetical protein
MRSVSIRKVYPKEGVIAYEMANAVFVLDLGSLCALAYPNESARINKAGSTSKRGTAYLHQAGPSESCARQIPLTRRSCLRRRA